MLEDDGVTEIRRNELAQSLGCVPSQINYVISSRFTPERGYVVESRRGGGGYIKISRISLDAPSILTHAVNCAGSSLDFPSCRANVMNLLHAGVLSSVQAKLILAATSEGALKILPPSLEDEVRAAIFKRTLLAVDLLNAGDKKDAGE